MALCAQAVEEEDTECKDCSTCAVEPQIGLSYSDQYCDIYQLYNALQFGFVDKAFVDIRPTSEFEMHKIYEFVNIPLSIDSDHAIKTLLNDASKTKLRKQIEAIYLISNDDIASLKKDISFCQYLAKIGVDVPIVIVNKSFSYFAEKFPFLCYVKSYEKAFVTQYPSQILNNQLFLGNIDHAVRKDILKNLKITRYFEYDILKQSVFVYRWKHQLLAMSY
eukprot:663945_1